jgi:primosomal protein N' (replication factor Y)
MTDKGHYAEVALGMATEKLFHYRVPPSLVEAIAVGKRVLVPLGRRFVIGYVVRLSEDAPDIALKEIQEVVGEEPPLDPHLMELTGKVADDYLAPWGEVIRLAFPPSTRSPGRWVFRLATDGLALPPSLSPLESKLWEALQSRSPLSLGQLQRRAGTKDLHTILERMNRNGWVTREMVPVRSRRAARAHVPAGSLPEPQSSLLPEEGNWPTELEPVRSQIENCTHRTFLLFGASWKQRAHWYRRVFDFLLRSERGALLLVPEIESASPWVEEMKAPFRDQMAVLHSGLSSRERARQWRRIQEGEALIVIGTRSAIFVPHPRLALILIDEEQDSSYKQQEGPRYHAREVAQTRARMLNIPLLLASRTPSIESFYKAEQGEYHLLSVADRREEDLADISLVDMREEAKDKPKGFLLSSALKRAIEQTLTVSEQVILLINRRGYFGHLLCRDCGFQLQCPRCSVPFVLHRPQRRLICHRCGREESPPERCPSCRGLFMRYLGPGTQQLEEEVRRLFPGAKVARLDRDLFPPQAKPHPLHLSFGRGEIDILVGTQMVIKALQHGRASLIGLLSADNLLSLPDFRAGERLFSLLVAMIRDGRGRIPPSRIFIQTYNPGSYVLQAIRNRDWNLFYRKEIAARKVLCLPPFSHLALVEAAARREEGAKRAAFAVASLLQAERPPSLLLDGPAPSPHLRLKGRFHWRFLLKGERIPLLYSLRRALGQFEGSAIRGGVTLRVDIDPVRLY